MTPRHSARYAGAATALLFALTACGSSPSTPDATAEPEVRATPSAEVTTTPATDAKVVAMTLTADSVDPSGDEVAVKPGQPVVLKINAEKAGELHVHSSPEQHIAFPAGDSEVTLSFDKFGVIDVEDHALDMLIVRIKVS